MISKNKFFIIGLILIAFLSISCVCAGENETISNGSNQDLVSEDETVVEDNYDAEFIVDDFTAKYSPYNEFNVLLVDDYGDEIYGEDVRLVWNNGKQEELYEWDDYSGYNTYMDKNVGNYKATVVLKDSYYHAKPVTINVKITKATVKLTAKKWVSTTKQYSYMKVYVKDSYGDPVDEGTVKFTINSKSYNVKVHDGVAIKKIKLTKAKNYKYKATFTGKNYVSKSTTSKVYVKKVKKYYTLKIRNPKIKKTFKVKLPYKKYVKVLKAKNNNKLCIADVFTGIKRPEDYGGGYYSVGLSVNDDYHTHYGYAKGDYIYLYGGGGYLCLKKVNLYTANF